MSNIEEKYARSIQSSHLEVTEFVGDVDSLIAAGWIQESLATQLYRLRVEFDRCDKKALAASAGSLTDRVLVLSRMTSLIGLRTALFSFTAGVALRHGIKNVDVMSAMASAMDVWLDPNCPRCDGRGSNGGYGKPSVLCVGRGGCSGSGKRRARYESDAAHLLGELLLTEISRKTARVNDLMKRFTSQQPPRAKSEQETM